MKNPFEDIDDKLSNLENLALYIIYRIGISESQLSHLSEQILTQSQANKLKNWLKSQSNNFDPKANGGMFSKEMDYQLDKSIDDSFLTLTQTCHLLQRSRQTVLSWRRAGYLPIGRRISGSLYFSKADILKAISEPIKKGGSGK